MRRDRKGHSLRGKKRDPLGYRTIAAAVVSILLFTSCTGSNPEEVSTADGQSALSEVPELTNLKLPRAKELIDEAQLEVGRVKRIGDGSRGIVLAQGVPSGTEVRQNTSIDLTISKPFPVPLLSIPRLAEFAWTCRGQKTIITFRVPTGGATTRVSYPARSGQRLSRRHGPSDPVTVPLIGSQRWRLVQRTAPRTLRADVSLKARTRCLSFAPPRSDLSLQGRSHSRF